MGGDQPGDVLTELAVAARDGDVLALGAFARATYRDVWRFCAALDDPRRADDLTQEVFVRVLRALPAFHGGGSARTWLFVIARRTVADGIRAKRRDRRLEDQATLLATHAGNEHAEMIAVVDLLRRLDADRRTAFALTQVAGLSYAEAADVCGCPLGTIRSRVARARADLIGSLCPADIARKATSTTS